MISRLTALAATFAILATATLTYAASAHQATLAAPAAAAKSTRIVQLERVVVTAKRADYRAP
jgi:hypothetical protein